MRLEYLSPAIWALMAASTYYLVADKAIIPLFLAPAICETYLLLLPWYLHTRADFQHEFPRFVLKLAVVLALVWSLLAWYTTFFFELWFTTWNSTILPVVFSILVACFAPVLLGPHLAGWVTLKPVLLDFWTECHQEVWEEKEAKRLEWVAFNRAGSTARHVSYMATVEREIAFLERSNDLTKRRAAARKRRELAILAREEEEELIRKTKIAWRDDPAQRPRRLSVPIMNPAPADPLVSSELTAAINDGKTEHVEVFPVEHVPAFPAHRPLYPIIKPTEDVLLEPVVLAEPRHRSLDSITEPAEDVPLEPVVFAEPAHTSMTSVIKPAEDVLLEPVVLSGSEPEVLEEPAAVNPITNVPADLPSEPAAEPTQEDATLAVLAIQLSNYIYDCIESRFKDRFGEILIEPEMAVQIVRAIEIVTETWDKSIAGAIEIADQVVKDLETKLAELATGQDGDSSSDDSDDDAVNGPSDQDSNFSDSPDDNDDDVYGPSDHGSSLAESSSDSDDISGDDNDDNDDDSNDMDNAVCGPSDHGSSLGDSFSNSVSADDDHDDENEAVNGPSDHGSEIGDLSDEDRLDDAAQDLSDTCNDYDNHDEHEMAQDHSDQVSGLAVSGPVDDSNDNLLSDLFSSAGGSGEDGEDVDASGVWNLRNPVNEVSGSDLELSDDFVPSHDSEESGDALGEDENVALSDMLSSAGDSSEDVADVMVPGVWDYRDSGSEISDSDLESSDDVFSSYDSNDSEDDFGQDDDDDADLVALRLCIAGLTIRDLEHDQPDLLPEVFDAAMMDALADTVFETDTTAQMLPPVNHVEGLTLPSVDFLDASMVDTPATVVPDTNSLAQVPTPVNQIDGLTLPADETFDAAMLDELAVTVFGTNTLAQTPFAVGNTNGLTLPAIGTADASMEGTLTSDVVDTTVSSEVSFATGSESLQHAPVAPMAHTPAAAPPQISTGGHAPVAPMFLKEPPSQDVEFNSAEYLRTVPGWTEEEILMDCEIAGLFRADEERQAQHPPNPLESQNPSHDWIPSPSQSFQFDLGVAGSLPMPDQAPPRKISKPKGRLEKIGAERLQQIHAEAQEMAPTPQPRPEPFNFNTPLMSDTSASQPSQPFTFSPIFGHRPEGAFEPVQIAPPGDNEPIYDEVDGMQDSIPDDANTDGAIDNTEAMETALPETENGSASAVVDSNVENPELEAAPEPMVASEHESDSSPAAVSQPAVQSAPTRPRRRRRNLDEAAPPIIPALLVAPTTPSPYRTLVTPSTPSPASSAPSTPLQTPTVSSTERPRVEPGSRGKAPPRKSANTSNPLMSRSFKQRKKKE